MAPGESAVDRPQLARTLVRAAREVTARAETVLKPEGLTFDQWMVLDTMAIEDGLSMAELADRTLITGPTLTRLVDRLVSQALAYREVAPADRRKVQVHLSKRGQQRHERIVPLMAEMEQELLSGRSALPAALESLF